jgi:hypothetical protein
MESEKLREHIFSTYRSLRNGMVLIAFFLPLILMGWAWLLYGIPLQASLSDYYWAAPNNPVVDRGWALFLDHEAPARVWFVGAIFALAACLYVYKGFSPIENRLLNWAAIATVGVGIVPTCKPGAECGTLTLHGGFAVAAFLLLACTVWFCRNASLDEYPKNAEPPADDFKRRYLRHAVAMAAIPLLIFVANHLGEIKEWVFLAETAAIWIFARYWQVKSQELNHSKLTRKVLMGRQRAVDGDATVPVAKAITVDKTRGVRGKLAQMLPGE